MTRFYRGARDDFASFSIDWTRGRGSRHRWRASVFSKLRARECSSGREMRRRWPRWYTRSENDDLPLYLPRVGYADTEGRTYSSSLLHVAHFNHTARDAPRHDRDEVALIGPALQRMQGLSGSGRDFTHRGFARGNPCRRATDQFCSPGFVKGAVNTTSFL